MKKIKICFGWLLVWIVKPSFAATDVVGGVAGTEGDNSIMMRIQQNRSNSQSGIIKSSDESLARNGTNSNLLQVKKYNQAQKLTASLKTYIGELEEAIKAFKRRGSIWDVFVRREVRNTSLFGLIEMGLLLADIHEVVNQESKDSMEERLKNKLQGTLVTSKKIGTKVTSYNNYFKEFSPGIVRPFYSIVYCSLLLQRMQRYLEGKPIYFKMNDLQKYFVLACSSLGIMSRDFMVKWSRKDLIAVTPLIESVILYPLLERLFQEPKLFPCNPLGLIIPFWVYYSGRYASEDLFEKEVIPMLEKYKNIAASIYMPKGILVPTLQTLGYPNVIAEEVASFLDIGQTMLTLYPELLKTMNTFCFDSAVVPITVNIPPIRYSILVGFKLLSTSMFTISMVLSIPYFVGSLLSIQRENEILEWFSDPVIDFSLDKCVTISIVLLMMSLYLCWER